MSSWRRSTESALSPPCLCKSDLLTLPTPVSRQTLDNGETKINAPGCFPESRNSVRTLPACSKCRSFVTSVNLSAPFVRTGTVVRPKIKDSRLCGAPGRWVWHRQRTSNIRPAPRQEPMRAPDRRWRSRQANRTCRRKRLSKSPLGYAVDVTINLAEAVFW
jgi:hypothetical protein